MHRQRICWHRRGEGRTRLAHGQGGVRRVPGEVTFSADAPEVPAVEAAASGVVGVVIVVVVVVVVVVVGVVAVVAVASAAVNCTADAS